MYHKFFLFMLSAILFFNRTVSFATNYNMSTASVTAAPGDNFYDSGGSAGNYGFNENFVFTFYPCNTGEYVVVNFSAFATFEQADTLSIFDGRDVNSPKIATYFGSTSPVLIGARNPDGCLTFRFKSNGSNNTTGWAAVISCSTAPGSTAGIYPMTNNAVDSVCGGTFYDSGGSGNYTTNESRVMTFFPATKGQYIQLNFSAFATSSRPDSLSIFDGPNTSSPKMATYYGNSGPALMGARNSGGCLTVRFKSDASTETTGWTALIGCSVTPGSLSGNYPMTTGAVDSLCGGTFYDAGGTTDNYGVNENRVMTFYPGTKGQYIQLNFSAFATSSRPDSLSIFDGPNTSSPKMATYYGNSGPALMGARNSGGCLTVRFKSDGGPSETTGWTALIGCSVTPGSLSGNYPMTVDAVDSVCGGTFYDAGGTTDQYGLNENRVMTFFPATKGQYLQLNFSAFANFEIGDSLSIFDGSNTASPKIATYYFNSGPALIGARNSGGSLTARFVSNGSNNSTGWTALIGCSVTPGSLNGNYPMTNGAVDTICGGTFYDSGGTTDNYTVNESRVMTFYPGTAGEYLRFGFSAFATFNEASNIPDSLSIFDGPNVNSPKIGTYYGNSSPGFIGARNSAGCLTFRFKSSGSNNTTGWTATVTCSPVAGTTTGNYPMTNGGVDTVCAGTFYDSGGTTDNYFLNESRVMTFYPSNAGERVQVNFTSFATFNSADSLTIFDGPNTSSARIGGYHTNNNPGLILSCNTSGRCLTFRFKSDGASNSTGWAASIGCLSSTCSALPVTLLSFTGYNKNDVNILEWQTASETNNDYFTVERSNNGIDWEIRGTVKGAGNSSHQKKYEFMDQLSTLNPVVSGAEPSQPSTVLYYRLKQTDFDGKYEYSAIVAVTFATENSFRLNIYPNPSDGSHLNIILNGMAEQNILLVLRDVFGTEIYSKALFLENDQPYVISLGSEPSSPATSTVQVLAKGVYAITVSGKKGLVSRKIIIQ